MANHRVTESYDYNAICDVCGFKMKASQIRLRWDGLRVCEKDWETRHIADFYYTRNDTHTLPFTRPADPKTTYLSLGTLTDPYANPEAPTNAYDIQAAPSAAFTTAITNLDNYSIMAWIRPRALGVRGFPILGNRLSSTLGSFSFEVVPPTLSVKRALQLNSASTFIANSPQLTVQGGNWQHVAVTRELVGSTYVYRFYVNGLSVGAEVLNTSLGTLAGLTDNLSIGKAVTSNAVRCAVGDIRDIRMFSGALTPLQVNQYKADSMSMSTTATGLLLWYKCNDGTGSTIADSQTNITQSPLTIVTSTDLTWNQMNV
jgi:hypothetical protein